MENKQKLIIGAVIAGVLAIGVGIGSANKGAPDTSASSDTGTTQVDPAPAPEPVYTDEDYFITEVRSSGNSYVDNNSDSDLIKIGHQTCDVLDQGYTVTDVAQYLVENGNSNDSAFYEFEGIVIGAAVRNLCPEYIDQIP